MPSSSRKWWTIYGNKSYRSASKIPTGAKPENRESRFFTNIVNKNIRIKFWYDFA